MSDLPNKWPAVGSPQSGTDQGADQGIWTQDLLTCLTVEPSNAGPVTAWATSPTFADSPYGAGSRIELTTTAEIAKARFDTLSKSNVTDCLQKSPGSVWKLGDPEPADPVQKVERVARLEFPPFGDQVSAFRVKVTKAHAAGQINAGKSWTAVIDLVIVRAGRSLVQMAFGGGGGSLPTEWEQNMTQTVTDRIVKSTATSS
ncbi:hypothetical protein [Nocardia sp. XZ_19_231]|uniref:hypothetical protein n=1 Tax=Nocardia sp. XZ_19_231 TaxID=2769252 RepID=UPI00188E7843|nr:hypothetical protein [Nocardia sp. XZ_19_231]